MAESVEFVSITTGTDRKVFSFSALGNESDSYTAQSTRTIPRTSQTFRKYLHDAQVSGW